MADNLPLKEKPYKCGMVDTYDIMSTTFLAEGPPHFEVTVSKRVGTRRIPEGKEIGKRGLQEINVLFP